jgi:uncharacterized protein (TIGR03067 family)
MRLSPIPDDPMRFLHPTSATLIILFTSIGSADDGAVGFPKEVHGEWTVVSAEWSGKTVPKKVASQMRVTVKAKTIIVSPLVYLDNKFDTKGEATEFSYKIDPKSKPKAFELILKDDQEELRQLGIYEVSGTQLKLCWQHDGKGRPKEFKTAEEPTQIFLVLERRGLQGNP